jgi:hypothetical protein
MSGSFWEDKLLRPRLKAKLTEQEDKMLFELRKSASVSGRVKDRAQVIRLSHEGWFVELGSMNIQLILSRYMFYMYSQSDS